MISIRRYKNSS